MDVARTLRSDREKMGDQPMYRPSQGPGQPKQQPRQAGAAGPRTRRGEDPLAELARLIGQEDPFKEFDAVQPRRVPANGNGAVSATETLPERRPDRYAGSNGAAYANGAAQPRNNGHAASADALRPASRFSQPAAAAPVRTPIARTGDERYPAPRAPRAPAPTGQARGGGEPAARSLDTQARPALRPLSRDTSMQPVRTRDAFANTELRSARAPVAPDPRSRRPEPQPASRYQPEETPRHTRGRPQQDQYQRYEDDYDPDYDDDAYLPEHSDDIYDDVERPRRGWGFWVVSGIVAASLITVGLLGVFAYQTIFNTPQRAAIVTKSDAPVKVEPKNSPQTAVPQSNKPIQDRVGGMDQQKTQIMRREEAPTDLTRPAAQPQPPVMQPQQQQPSFTPPQQPQVQRAPQFTPPVQQQQQAPQTDNQPKRVKSVPLRADGPVQPQSNAPMPLGPTAQADETQSVAQHRPTAPTRTTVASLGPTAPAVQTSGNYVVQVASHKTPDEAQNAWNNLRQQYSQIFSGRNADIRKVDLGDRGTFYRAMVGPMSREQANALCQNLKTQGAGCIVQTR